MITAARSLAAAQTASEARCTRHFITQYLQLILAYLHISPVNESVGLSRFWRILCNTNVLIDMHVFHTAPLIIDTFEQAREASQYVCNMRK